MILNAFAHVFRSVNVTDGGLRHVARLSSLTDLNLKSCGFISDIGVAELSMLPSLTSINLESCQNVTGGALAGLTALRAVKLAGCPRLKPAALDHVMARLPALQITR